ncbi:DNA polymerase I [Usitatibacter rugosus]|uniref:DNA polymerase I n=1 Tax=Usitatibacter rugosus TaxID=2732067 RepID=A0A6M4GP76_9PROT|nr:DNA polymerase I [Usitatibacter rugosus]QJR09120.1 DNA polymerase I [Usitatibacter rugosus]
MTEAQKTILLVDFSGYLYRAFFAIKSMTSPAGEPTNAIYGVVNMLRKAKQDFPSDYIACVLDPKGKTFRDEIYADYKATRSAMPEDLASQIEPLIETIGALGWPIVVVDGVEADDVIGTIAAMARREGWKTIISTGDKDLTQLVDERTLWVNTMSGDRLGPEGVKEKFGVPPERIIDYLALVGDTVDNVPGVDKVGPKTAAKLIQEYGSLDGLMANAAQVKGAVGENLRKALDWLPTAKTLVTVKCDVELPFAVETLVERDIDREKLLGLFERFGFRTLRDAILKTEDAPEKGDAPAPAADSDEAKRAAGARVQEKKGRNFAILNAGIDTVADAVPFVDTRNYETILDGEALERWARKLEAATLASVDTETTSLDPMLAEIVGISFSAAPGEGAYIPLTHRYAGAPDQLPIEGVLARLKPWLEDASKAKVGQNTKYDRQVFASYGIATRGFLHDTLLESYVFQSHQRHDMDALATRFLGASGLMQYTDVAGKGASSIPFDQVDIARAAAYSAEDADVTLQIHGALWPRVEADAKLKRIYADIEIPVSSVLLTMERNGVLIDGQLLAKQGQELGQKMLDLERKAHELAGGPFNLGSPKQLAEILFVRMGLKAVKKTPSGAPSTDEEVLEKLAEDHPLARTLLDHRSVSKLKSTYTDKLPRMVHPKTGRVHTNYAQAVAVTGRLSSNDPNLQNIPVRTTEGRRIREAFVAPAASKIVSADYSQIELRIMAHLSGDKSLIDAFSRGEDIHRHTAAEVFGATTDEVTSEQRRYAKVINFGLIYGMSAFGLAGNLGIERSAAASYMDKYFARYPGVAQYMDRTRQEAKEHGYVETVFGRRLWLPDINSGNAPRRQGAERQAINAPMQGTAADLIKLAMIAVQGWLEREKLATKLVMQVHDELVLEVPENELDRVKPEVEKLMMGVATLDVPLVVEAGVGDNWEKAH